MCCVHFLQPKQFCFCHFYYIGHFLVPILELVNIFIKSKHLCKKKKGEKKVLAMHSRHHQSAPYRRHARD